MKKPIIIIATCTFLIISLMLAVTCMVIMLRDKNPTPTVTQETVDVESPLTTEKEAEPQIETPAVPKSYTNEEKLLLAQKLMRQYLHSENVSSIIAAESSVPEHNPFGEGIHDVDVQIHKDGIEKETSDFFVYRAYVFADVSLSEEIKGSSKNEIYMELKRVGDTYQIADFEIGSAEFE